MIAGMGSLQQAEPNRISDLFSWRSIAFSLFLFAGIFKSSLNIPVDFTILTGMVIILFCIIDLFKAKTISVSTVFLGVLWVSLLSSLFNTSVGYGADKAIRFYTFTLIAGFSPIIIFKNRSEILKLFHSLILTGIIISFSALANFRDLGQFDRLQAFDANIINLGRAVGLALVFVLTLWLYEKISNRIGSLLIIPMVFVMLSFGSRGPIFAVIVALLPLIFIRIKNTAAILRLSTLFLISLAFGAVLLPLIPSQSILRIANLISGNEDQSSTVRFETIQIVLPKILDSPFGIGLGQFSSIMPSSSIGATLDYPHNVFLEIALEGGWIPFVIFTVLIIMALFRTLGAARNGSFIAALAFGGFAFALFSSSVSGDINDNKFLWSFLGIALAVKGFNTVSEVERK